MPPVQAEKEIVTTESTHRFGLIRPEEHIVKHAASE